MTAAVDEAGRAHALEAAQARALELVEVIDDEQVLAPGTTEKAARAAIKALAAERFGVERHWHKRIVRAGPNTLLPYRENPPDRVIGADDIVFCDLGPIFTDWEADVGRTFVVGGDPVKRRLRDDLTTIFNAGRAHFQDHEDVTGEQLYAFVAEQARAAGWEYGNAHCGHLVGEFPHELVDGERIESYIAPGSTEPMRRPDRAGRPCHWILEIHLVDRARGFGGFLEQLLDLGPDA